MLKYLLTTILLMTSFQCLHAQSWIFKGNVQNRDGYNLEDVQINVLGTSLRTASDAQGNFEIQLENRNKTSIRFTLLGYEYEVVHINRPKDIEAHQVFMTSLRHQISQVDVSADKSRNEAGTIKIGIDQVEKFPSAIGGVEGLLKVLVGSNNELTSQYSVRGGNFDENLVYVNDFEIHRPLLVRSGQQEGLSFIHPELVQNINFSVGGFQAKYGDKLSSVLDVTYKKAEKFGGSVALSLLGGQAHLEGANKKGTFRYLVGARQKSNQYLLGAQPVKGNYEPSFTDVQLLIDGKLHDKLDMQVIGNYARNRFKFQPVESSQAFGVVNQVLRLRTKFDGQEDDAFDTRFLGLSFTHYATDKLQLKWLLSAFQSQEYERYDINGMYGLYEVESDMSKKEFGQDKYALGTASIHKYARNELFANVFSFGHRGAYDGEKHYIQWGANAKKIIVDDYMNEWHRRDSAKFTQPFHPTEIISEYVMKADHKLSYETFDAYIQDNILFDGLNKMNLNIGVRTLYNNLNKEWLIMPRAQWSIAPNWERDMMFKFGTGIYGQPAFYREMRHWDGTLNTDLKAQKSWHITAGVDYHFKALAERPFKLVGEVFYKHLWDLVPYEYDDVRIRYYSDNIARGYAYGAELRLFADLVKDAESWISVGYLSTKEQLYDEQTDTWSEFRPRPTDQRVSIGVFFSDYIPRYKNFKVYLNMMYVTGLPIHPSGQVLEIPEKTMRLPDYKRVDIGFAALLLDGKKQRTNPIWNKFDNIWLTAEVLNLLAIENTLSYQWVQDFTTNHMFAVPNKLSNRLLNLKLSVHF